MCPTHDLRLEVPDYMIQQPYPYLDYCIHSRKWSYAPGTHSEARNTKERKQLSGIASIKYPHSFTCQTQREEALYHEVFGGTSIRPYLLLLYPPTRQRVYGEQHTMRSLGGIYKTFMPDQMRSCHWESVHYTLPWADNTPAIHTFLWREGAALDHAGMGIYQTRSSQSWIGFDGKEGTANRFSNPLTLPPCTTHLP